MLVLMPNEVCKLVCQYSERCNGTNPNRNVKFTCEFLQEDGSIKDRKMKGRNSLDQTGKMEVLMETPCLK